jgi:hypothetical protein
MRKTSTFVLLAGALLFGCSGGGSSSGDAGVQDLEQAFQFGLVRADVPTLAPLTITKPFYPASTVELAEPPTGAFEPLAGMLPMSVEGGHDMSLWITFTPPSAPAAAEQEGTIRLLFRRAGGGQTASVTLHLRAQVETPSVRLLQTEVRAGDVFVGETERFGVYVENTSAATPVTVTEVTPPEGDFSFAPDATPLPMLIGAGSRLYLRLQYAPQELGSSSSSIRVFHSAAAEPLEATVTGKGVERPSARLLQTQASAGNVVVGETAELGLYVENTSFEATVTVTDVTPPFGDFSIAPDAPALPAEIAAGATLYVPLVYAPQAAGNSSSLVRIYTSAAAVALEATVTGNGVEPLLVFDIDVPLDTDNWTYESEWHSFDVPAEAVGIFLEAKGDPSSLIDLIGFEGPGGVVYENYDMTGPLDWTSFYPAGGNGYLNIELPSSDLPEVQLVSGGGTYSFRLRDSNYATGSLQVRVTVTQRTAAKAEKGTLDLRVFLADGLGIDPGAAMYDPGMAEVMKTIDAIFGMSDVRLGNITFTWMDPAYDTLWDEAAMQDMVAVHTLGLPEGTLNLFFVTDMAYGVAGVAGAVPGPRANGTPFSGVVIDFGEGTGIEVGVNAAHQMGHYLGHTDPAGEEEGVLLLPHEAYAVLRHPLLNPGLPQDLLSPPESTDYAEILAAIDEMPTMDTWCGTCTRAPVR